jgi:4'-phosphopantetheinyl transferase
LASPALKNNEIHLWYCDGASISDKSLLDRYHLQLNNAEQKRLKQFQFPKDQHRYLVTRALVRNVLSLYISAIQPQQWKFVSNQNGKPAISNPIFQPLKFNVSHTASVIVMAVTLQNEIGVDIELKSKSSRSMEIADHFFSPDEAAYLNSLPEHLQKERFCELWTLKEAYIKAKGVSLITSFDKFSFQFLNENHISFKSSKEKISSWKFWLFEASEKYKIALAKESEEKPVNIFIREIVPGQKYASISWQLLRS